MKLGSDSLKRLTLELGGNAPFIVFDDANIDQAVAALMASKFRNAGQTCVCADRVLLASAIHDEFVSKFVARAKDIAVGSGMDEGTSMGPLITSQAVQDIDDKVREAVREGATCVTGGSPLPNLGPHFYDPTVLINVSPDSRIWKTETFGPVAAIYKFETEEEALALANDSNVGLAAYFCTKDLERAFRFARK
jgi:succinate-semialdehyde dehydrogenase/glutarate-semialdehyde dehydrogenase